MTIQCPDCGARYKLNPATSQKSGAKVKCPKCLNVFQISVPRKTGATAPPRAKKPPQVPASPPAPAPAQSVGAPRGDETVLVVDDSRFFRELIVDVLKPLPLSILTAADGMEAMTLIRRGHPALVILDLNLPPGKNGYDLIRDIRADPSLKGIRLLAMSGVFRKKTDVAEVEMAGADDFISKSFTPEQLQSRVAGLLQG
jgi:predicted Zn finger-like uncharacterized protein